MSIDDDRRIQGPTRIPFEALVEVGGALGPTFEAQAVDLSEEGMHLRTAYLPDLGQPMTCRFEAGSTTVMVGGEVVWREEAGRGGEFGIRFTNLDPDSAIALDRIVGIARGSASQDPGARVRLHIEGLGSPMRARVKEAGPDELTVGSELGFLQVGKQLELEDAATGSKRPARIDRVDVQIDPVSRVPQLVVTLRYDEISPVEAEAAHGDDPPREPRVECEEIACAEDLPPKEITPSPAVIDGPAESHDAPPPAMATEQAPDDLESIRKASEDMKGAFARGASRIGPALSAFARRTKTTVALLASRRMRENEAIPLRRTTSPPPGGGLRATGRRVVRGDSSVDAQEALAGLPRPVAWKRKVTGAAVVATAVIVGVLVVRKATTPSVATASVAPPVQASAPLPPPPPVPAPQPDPGGTLPPSIPAVAGGAPLAAPPAADVEINDGAPQGEGKHRNVHVAPFGNGSVAHGNVIHLKMDGAIEKLEGAATPTGFSVRLPNRRSLEAAAPLAARDGRIASMHITNEANGAELAVAFKDGVPNYQVRARGETLEILLAPAGKVEGEPPHGQRLTESTAAIPRRKRGKHLDKP